MGEVKALTVGELIPLLVTNGSDFTMSLSDPSGMLIVVIGSDGVDYHMLKTDTNGQLELVYSP